MPVHSLADLSEEIFSISTDMRAEYIRRIRWTNERAETIEPVADWSILLAIKCLM